jgi:hypothetical protein
MLSAYLDTSAACWPFSGSRDFDRRGFNARPPEQLLREPRRIEILGYEIVWLAFSQPSRQLSMLFALSIGSSALPAIDAGPVSLVPFDF